MTDAVPIVESTGTAPATPGASPTDTPLAAPAAAAPESISAPVVAIPDKYEFKLGEGRELDAGLIEAVTPLFKEFGLTQDAAAKLVTAYDQYGQTFEAAQEKQFQAFMVQTAKENLTAIKSEWGSNYDVNLSIAQRGLTRFMSDAGKKQLEDAGLGNNPEILKAFYQAGKMIQEDRPPLNVVPKANGSSKLFTKSIPVGA